MRKWLTLLLVFMLVLAACGGDDDDDDDVGSIEDAETCDEVGAVFLDELQVLLDELSDMSAADAANVEGSEAMTNFQTSVEEIGARADELECSDEQMVEYLTENIDELEAEGPVAELLLEGFREGIQSGEIFE